MASVRKEPGEVVPLLYSRPLNTAERGVSIRVEASAMHDDFVLSVTSRSSRKVSQVALDAFLLLLRYVQMLALLLSLSLRWPWPQSWLNATSFAFLLNFDVWDFAKLRWAFVSARDYFTPSAAIGFSFRWVMVAWGVLLCIAAVVFVAVFIHQVRQHHPHMLVRLSRLKHVYVVLVHVISLPLATAIARLFHCTDTGVVDVDNDLKCFHPLHWLYLAPAILVAVCVYVVVPLWLVMRTRAEMLDMTASRHEAYLQLKENEFVLGLDVVWAVDNFHIFSSFKKYGAHTRAFLLVSDGVICMLCAVLFRHTVAQAITLCLVFLFLSFIVIIIRPFRVSVFNYMLFLNFLCLTLNAMMGALQVTFAASAVRMIWLIPKYATIILAIINVGWLTVAFVFLVYLTLRSHCCKTKPLWPALTSGGEAGKLAPETKKYIKALLHGRILIDQVMMMPPLFAPVPEIDRQIHVVNAFFREAQYLGDPLMGALWDLLDELIEVHSKITPKSLFAFSVKDSIRLTTTDLMKMMPSFVRRLAQREYDFILVRPVKRRLLLKLYCLSLFLKHRRRQTLQQRLTFPAIQKIWQPPTNSDEYEDDGYYEDMYPEREDGPTFRPTTSINLAAMTRQDLEDEAAIEEAEEWTRLHPMTPQTHLNLAFIEDDFLDDSESAKLSQMLDDIPALPADLDRQSSSLSLSVRDDKSRPASSRHLRHPSPSSSDDRNSPLPGQIS